MPDARLELTTPRPRVTCSTLRPARRPHHMNFEIEVDLGCEDLAAGALNPYTVIQASGDAVRLAADLGGVRQGLTRVRGINTEAAPNLREGSSARPGSVHGAATHSLYLQTRSPALLSPTASLSPDPSPLRPSHSPSPRSLPPLLPRYRPLTRSTSALLVTRKWGLRLSPGLRTHPGSSGIGKPAPRGLLPSARRLSRTASPHPPPSRGISPLGWDAEPS